MSGHHTTASWVDDVRRLHQQISGQQRELLASLAVLEEREAWLDDGARDMAHWVSMQLGVSYWKASRWVAAGAALRELPETARALESGGLSIDKVVELTRLATPSRERGLIAWAERVSSGAIRRRADLENRIERHEVQDAEESRAVSWWYFDEGRRFALEAAGVSGRERRTCARPTCGRVAADARCRSREPCGTSDAPTHSCSSAAAREPRQRTTPIGRPS